MIFVVCVALASWILPSRAEAQDAEDADEEVVIVGAEDEVIVDVDDNEDEGESSDASTSDTSSSEAVEIPTVEVTAEPTAGERLQNSARAVEVVDTEEASRESADMGEVLAREEGVGVRRTGGLGSGTRFSLHGLTDKQIRFFLDGVPLEFAGFPGGIANVPVNLIERVDIYSGVVPIRLGADALGGAVDLITSDLPEEDGLMASYQFGSFGTHRSTVSGRLVDHDSGIFARANGFFDYASNDYDVDIEVADDAGRISRATVPRFHDGYRAAGGGLEVGVADRPWADRLSVRLFGSDLGRELQHNLIMTVPYGEASWRQSAAGGVLRYEHRPTEETRVDVATGYNFSRSALQDLSECLYDWYGRCVSEQRRAGELGQFPSDRVMWEHAAFARLNGAWSLGEAHSIRLSAAPTVVTRTGDERVEIAAGQRDPLSAQRDLVDLVTGLEYEAELLDDRLQNIVFVKDYVQHSATEEPLASGRDVHRDLTTHHLGYGDSLRYRFYDWLYAKASYERAIRLPTPEEFFGDALFIQPNLELKPERSHNLNLQLGLDDLESSWGTWRGNLTGFLRDSDELIVLLGNSESFTYRNVLSARSVGAEAAAGWSAPGKWAALDANLTYVDLRNDSDQGAFGDFVGDRIPNRPYLYSNATTRLTGRDLIADNDRVSLAWHTRYVHWYYRGWESLGRSEFKQVIPAQWQHGLALSHVLYGRERILTTTFEVQNLTDAKMYDFFGVQRPGRAFYLKTTLDL